MIRRVLFTRDPEGRLLREVSDSTPASFLKGVENAPADMRAALTEKIASMFTFITECRYDAHGGVHQRVRRTGLSEECETMLYDDYGNLLEQTTEHRSQEVRVEVQDDSRIGTTPVSESSNIQYSRFAYDYDERGNWIQRTSSYRLDPGSDFREFGIDRRQIQYFQ